MIPDSAATGIAALHPDCTDWRDLGPTEADAAIRAMGAAVNTDAENREKAWGKGFSRRRVLKGGLGVGVAALASQLVTTRVSYAANAAATNGTLVVVFLRGGMDGLSVAVPSNSSSLSGNDYDILKTKRPNLLSVEPQLLGFATGGRGFRLHPAMAALKPMADQGKLAVVPAISTPDLSRSHFQAQDCLERGGSGQTGVGSGWLDRVLEQSGAGTTFRAVTSGSRMPRAMTAASKSIVVPALTELGLSMGDEWLPATEKALRSLYTGQNLPIAIQAGIALDASATARELVKKEQQWAPTRTTYPEGEFGADLSTVATMIRTDVGVRVATVDVGGWDMHTQLMGDLDGLLKGVAGGLAAFFTDLGPAADKTTVVLMSEFGRRLEQNDNAGADHGHGGVAVVLGGGVRGGVHGEWLGLAPDMLDQGDVPGTNDYRHLLGEVVGKRIGLTAAQIQNVFPGFPIKTIGVMA